MDACPSNANRLSEGILHYSRQACTACGRCVDSCPEHAREVVGWSQSPENIASVLEKDAVFYRTSGGGVTFSGGEPFAQPDTLRSLAVQCISSGIPTAVETSGFFPIDDVVDIFESINEIFIDIKHLDDRIHRILTGVSNSRIIKNIHTLDNLGREITLRIPLVAGLTDTHNNIEGIVEICSRLKHVAGVELLPYHNLGSGKYQDLDLPCDHRLKPPVKEVIERITHRLRSQGIAVHAADTPKDRS